MRAERSLWSSKTVRWAVVLAAVAMVAVGLVLLFLLTLATGNRVIYEQNFQWLVLVNLAVAVLLLLVIVWFGVRLARRLYQGKFGSRLLLKLAGVFALVGLLPGLLIYTVSYQFVSRSIESWFDVRVEAALAAGLNLGRTTLNVLSSDMRQQAMKASEELADLPERSTHLALERWRDRLGASDVLLWDHTGQLLGGAGGSRYALNPQRPAPNLLRMAREEQVAMRVEGLDDTGEPIPGGAQAPVARLEVLALVAPSRLSLGMTPRYLQVISVLPEALVIDALAVQSANREYQERALGREGLRRMYIGTLTLALFLTVFGAVVIAVLLGNQLLRPLLVLAEGMREVAAGNLSPKLALEHRDELGGLTRSFARMTRDLAQAREAVDHSLAQVDAARAHVQTILDNLTAGVVVMDKSGCIISTNPSAERILKTPLLSGTQSRMDQVPGLESFSAAVTALFETDRLDDTQSRHWQQTFELGGGDHPSHATGTTLIARGAWLPQGEMLLVFDDVTDMVSAQRAKAWGEVARRLAHEIKNPLTPIQLSAERLALKLTPILDAPGQQLLNKSVRTIVDQVDAMKHLVNEFRDFGRLPAAVLAPLDLQVWLRDFVGLYEHNEVPVVLELGEEIPLILADAQQLRQVVHNLVQNAQDACAHVPAAKVSLRTRLTSSGRWVRLDIVDSGTGFDPDILKRAFEPYVTSKPKGTGLGLAVVHKIMEEHGGKIELTNIEKDGKFAGAKVSLSFAVDK